MQRTKRNTNTPEAAAMLAAPKTPPTESERRALQIEFATHIRDYQRGDAKDAIGAAMSQLRRMLEDIERAVQEPDRPLEHAVYSIRHNLAWANANISNTLDRADSAIRQMLVAQTKIDVLAPEPAEASKPTAAALPAEVLARLASDEEEILAAREVK